MSALTIGGLCPACNEYLPEKLSEEQICETCTDREETWCGYCGGNADAYTPEGCPMCGCGWEE